MRIRRAASGAGGNDRTQTSEVRSTGTDEHNAGTMPGIRLIRGLTDQSSNSGTIDSWIQKAL